MIFGFIRRSRSNARLIDRLHGEIMAGVRQASLYTDYGVADSFEGRFEVLALLASAVIRRLQAVRAAGPRPRAGSDGCAVSPFRYCAA